jgi:hypothetical protein
MKLFYSLFILFVFSTSGFAAGCCCSGAPSAQAAEQSGIQATSSTISTIDTSFITGLISEVKTYNQRFEQTLSLLSILAQEKASKK